MAGYNDPTYQRNRASILAGSPDCSICGKAKATTADHIVPMDAGGDHALENLRPACASCNYRLGAIYKNRKAAQRIQNRNNAMSKVDIRPCETCGKSFRPDWRNEARGGGRFCSKPCYGDSRRTTTTRWTWFTTWDCRICGQAMASDISESTEEPTHEQIRHTCGNTECQAEYNRVMAREAYRIKQDPTYQSELPPSTWAVHATQNNPEPFLSHEDGTPSPHPIIPLEGTDEAQMGPKADYLELTGRIEPRLVTPRSTDLSLGPAQAEWARRHMGIELMEWQRIALDGQLAVDDKGDFLFRESLVSTARQQGKSVALRALAGWFLADEARRRGRPVNVLLVANKLDRSMPMFRELALYLEDHHGAEVRWSNGSQQVTMPDRSTFRVAAAKDNVHGLTLDLILVDEIWDIAPSVIYDALRPSMIAVKNPLMSMWSTAGDQGSALMLGLREQAIAAIDAGKPGRLFFAEWSPPPAVNPDDRRWWPWANPALGTTVTWDALEAAAEGADRAAFLRAHLNLWVAATKAFLPIGTWDGLTVDEIPAGGILSVDNSVDESRYVGVRAVNDGGIVKVTVEFIVQSADHCWDAIAKVLTDPAVQLTLTPGLEALMPQHLERRMSIVGYGELLKYTPIVRALILEGRLRHDGSNALAEHVGRAVAVKTQNSTVLSSQKSPGPIELARCMVWAAAIAARPAQRTKPAFAFR